MNQRAWGSWLSFAEGVTKLLGQTVFQSIGGSIGGSVTTVEAYSFTQFQIAEQVARAIEERLRPFRDALAGLSEITQAEVISRITAAVTIAGAQIAAGGPIGVAAAAASALPAAFAGAFLSALQASEREVITRIITDVEFVDGIAESIQRAMALTEQVTTATEYAGTASSSHRPGSRNDPIRGAAATTVAGGTTVGGIQTEGVSYTGEHRWAVVVFLPSVRGGYPFRVGQHRLPALACRMASQLEHAHRQVGRDAGRSVSDHRSQHRHDPGGRPQRVRWLEMIRSPSKVPTTTPARPSWWLPGSSTGSPGRIPAAGHPPRLEPRTRLAGRVESAP